MTRGSRTLALLAGVCVAGVARSAAAQAFPRFEVSGLVTRQPGGAVSSASALLVPNESGTPTASVPLFRVSISEESRLVVGVRIAGYLAKHVAFEGAFTHGRPSLRAVISADAAGESPSPFTYAKGRESMLDGSVVIEAPPLAGRFRPFAIAGGGLLRQKLEGESGSVNGRVFRFGVGGKLGLWQSHGGGRRLGVRADLFEQIRTRLFEIDESSRRSAGWSVSMFAGF